MGGHPKQAPQTRFVPPEQEAAEVESVAKMIRALANRVVRREPRLSPHFEDIEQELRNEALYAARRFDPTRGAKLNTYMISRMNNRLGRIALQMRSLVCGVELVPTAKLPQSRARLGLANQSARSIDRHHDARASKRGGGDGDLTMPIPDLRLSPQTIEAREDVRALLARLRPRERLVLELRFWDALSLEEAGEVVGVTRERVRQIEAKALKKLREIGRSLAT